MYHPAGTAFPDRIAAFLPRQSLMRTRSGSIMKIAALPHAIVRRYIIHRVLIG
jgi:hypothetical protein